MKDLKTMLEEDADLEVVEAKTKALWMKFRL